MDDDLRRQVRVLSAGLGLSAPLFPLPPAVIDDARAGRTVEAAKGLRRHAPGGVSLLAAKRMVDVLAEPSA